LRAEDQKETRARKPLSRTKSLGWNSPEKTAKKREKKKGYIGPCHRMK